MTNEIIELMEPTLDLKLAYQDLAREYLELRSLAMIENAPSTPPRIKPYPYEDAMADFSAFVEKEKNMAQGIGLQEGSVPMTTFWLVRKNKNSRNDRTVLGHSALRHRLTPALEREGGHIGYSIRPSERRKGYGTQILALTLKKALERKIDPVLITCDSDNIGSVRIIQKNGGRLENQALSDRSGKTISRYWITLPG